MSAANEMRLGTYRFVVQQATFRFISDSISGPGWDFSFNGKCLNDRSEEPVFPLGFRLFSEAAPLPLRKAPDYLGTVVEVASPFDEASGEPYLGLYVGEEHDVPELQLRFVERDGTRYRVEVAATVAETLTGRPERLVLSAWTEELPDHAYPK